MSLKIIKIKLNYIFPFDLAQQKQTNKKKSSKNNKIFRADKLLYPIGIYMFIYVIFKQPHYKKDFKQNFLSDIC